MNLPDRFSKHNWLSKMNRLILMGWFRAEDFEGCVIRHDKWCSRKTKDKWICDCDVEIYLREKGEDGKIDCVEVGGKKYYPGDIYHWKEAYMRDRFDHDNDPLPEEFVVMREKALGGRELKPYPDNVPLWIKEFVL